MTINYEIRKADSGYVVVYVDRKGRPMSDSGSRVFKTYEEAEEFVKNTESTRREKNSKPR